MINTSTTESLLETLNAYVKHFETPSTREDLLAIASSILTFQQKKGSLAIAPDIAEDLIQQVVNQFKVETVESSVASSIADSSIKTLVQEVNQWRESLENQVLNTLNAYVQNSILDQPLNLPETILSIIPLVENFQLCKSQSEALIQRVTSKFDWQNALEQVIGAETVAIAEKLAKLLQLGNIEDLLKKNILELDRTLEGITESLVNNELEKILGDKTVTIDIETKDFMIKQVTLKLNIMQSSPPSSKSNEEIANQLDDEIEVLRKERQKQLGNLDIFSPAMFVSFSQP
jgi:hypothetical protein